MSLILPGLVPRQGGNQGYLGQAGTGPSNPNLQGAGDAQTQINNLQAQITSLQKQLTNYQTQNNASFNPQNLGLFTVVNQTTQQPTQTYLLVNATVNGAGVFVKTNISAISWALLFDLVSNTMQILYSPAGQTTIAFNLHATIPGINGGAPVAPTDLIRLEDLVANIFSWSPQTFTGDGTTPSFNLSPVPGNTDSLFVFLNGVYQPPGLWALVGGQLTPSSVVPAGIQLATTFVTPALQWFPQSFTGDGTTTVFQLTPLPTDAAHLMVFLGGVYQGESYWSLNVVTGQLTMVNPPPSGMALSVVYTTLLTWNYQTFTGDGATTAFPLNPSQGVASSLFVFLGGLYQTAWSLVGGSVVMGSPPPSGQKLIVNFAT